MLSGPHIRARPLKCPVAAVPGSQWPRGAVVRNKPTLGHSSCRGRGLIRCQAAGNGGDPAEPRQLAYKKLKEALAPKPPRPTEQGVEEEAAEEELTELLTVLGDLPAPAFDWVDDSDPPSRVLKWARKQKSKWGPGSNQSESAPMRAKSPGSQLHDLREWMAQHPLPANLTPVQLHKFISSMGLPRTVEKYLTDRVYHVPEEGLFTCIQDEVPGQQACARIDVVEELVDTARSGPRAYVTLCGGRRRTGKSFSNSWAQATAISLLEGQADQPAKRTVYVCYMPCVSDQQPPTVPELVMLLLSLAHLRIPTVFDEFSRWPLLPDAVETFLTQQLLHTSYPPLPMRPLHFLLQDSVQVYVQGVLGQRGVLLGRERFGLTPFVRMPQPSIHLIAGLLSEYHPSLYPSSLLRVVSTHGRWLTDISTQPCKSLSRLATAPVAGLTLMEGHFGQYQKVLNTVMRAGGTASCKRLGGLWNAALQLVDEGFLDLEPFDADQVVLSDPVLVTRSCLQSAVSSSKRKRPAVVVSEARFEERLSLAEGNVLEVVAREDLVEDILHALGLPGDGRHIEVWGRLGDAEFDLVVYWEAGPVVQVSCKRSQSAQNTAAFTSHINLLQKFVNDNLKSARKTMQKTGKAVEESSAVQAGATILRALTAPDSKLIMVGLSAVAVPGHQLDVNPIPVWLDEGQPREQGGVSDSSSPAGVPCSYVPLLLEQLVKPVPSEVVQRGVPLSSMREAL